VLAGGGGAVTMKKCKQAHCRTLISAEGPDKCRECIEDLRHAEMIAQRMIDDRAERNYDERWDQWEGIRQ
jgi:hypothetical protein